MARVQVHAYVTRALAHRGPTPIAPPPCHAVAYHCDNHKSPSAVTTSNNDAPHTPIILLHIEPITHIQMNHRPSHCPAIVMLPSPLDIKLTITLIRCNLTSPVDLSCHTRPPHQLPPSNRIAHLSNPSYLCIVIILAPVYRWPIACCTSHTAPVPCHCRSLVFTVHIAAHTTHMKNKNVTEQSIGNRKEKQKVRAF